MSYIRPEMLLEASLTIIILTNSDGSAGELTNKEHKTLGASVLKNELYCYHCDTMVEGDKCINLGIGNKSALIKKCHGDELLCMVKRYSYTTSTENSTSVLRMWSLKRNCTSTCEPGCIIIGERTKLYACTTCCSTQACNYGKGISNKLVINNSLLILTIIFTTLKFR